MRKDGGPVWYEKLLRNDAYGLVVVVPQDGAPEFIPLCDGAAIVTTIEEAAKRHPGCRVRLFLRENHWEYFEGIVPLENVY